MDSLRKLNIPGCLARVLFVESGSSDGTVALLKWTIFKQFAELEKKVFNIEG